MPARALFRLPFRPGLVQRALTLCVAIGLAGSLAGSLAGCETAAVLPAAAIAGTIEGVSLNQTGKTASDHVVSWVTGEDCSALRLTKSGKYCLTEAEVAQQYAALHRPYIGSCYRTRGGIACYDKSDERHTSETVVYNNP